jgi:hypothetical protein
MHLLIEIENELLGNACGERTVCCSPTNWAILACIVLRLKRRDKVAIISLNKIALRF